MSSEAIKAAIPQVHQKAAPVSHKKTSSTWNNVSVTVKRGCNKIADFFNKIFRDIGNFFKSVGKFLWNNKVTAAICAFLSAAVLIISACFLAMFDNKKEKKETDVKKPEEVKDTHQTEGNQTTTVDEVKPPEDNKNRPISVRHKFNKSSINVPLAKSQKNDFNHIHPGSHGLVARMQQQIQKGDTKEKDAYKTHDVSIKSSGLVARMQQQIQKGDKKEKNTDNKADRIKSPVNFGNIHNMLANIQLMPSQRPTSAVDAKKPATATNEEKKPQTGQRNTQELSDMLKQKPRMPKRRPSQRAQRRAVINQ